jgi:hypothetical protein
MYSGPSKLGAPSSPEAAQRCTKRVEWRAPPLKESPRTVKSNGGSVYALHPDLFTLTELFLFKAALLVVFIAGLYRLVREEVRRVFRPRRD